MKRNKRNIFLKTITSQTALTDHFDNNIFFTIQEKKTIKFTTGVYNKLCMKYVLATLT